MLERGEIDVALADLSLTFDRSKVDNIENITTILLLTVVTQTNMQRLFK